jgi:hypothetical protein
MATYSREEYQRNRVKHLARRRVHYLTRAGAMPRAAKLPCVDCGEPALEYDHYRGYEGDAAVDVQAVCKACHGRRSSERGEVRGPGPRVRRIRAIALHRARMARFSDARSTRYDEYGLARFDELMVREVEPRAFAQAEDAEAMEMAHVAFADAVSYSSDRIESANQEHLL